MSDASYTTFAPDEEHPLEPPLPLPVAAPAAQERPIPVPVPVPVQVPVPVKGPEFQVAEAKAPTAPFDFVVPPSLTSPTSKGKPVPSGAVPAPTEPFEFVAPPTLPTEALPYEKGGKLPPPEERKPAPITNEVIPNLVAGVVEGPIDTAGGYVDLGKRLSKASGRVGEPEPPLEGPPTASRLKSYLPLNIDPRYVYPPDETIKDVRKGFADASSAAAQYALTGGLRYAPGKLGSFGKFLNAGGVLGNTSAAFTGGITGEILADHIAPQGGDPDAYRAAGQLGGSLIPAIGSASVGRLPGYAAHQFFDPLNVPFFRPKHDVPGTRISATGKQLELAGRELSTEVVGKENVPGVIQDINSYSPLVPGSNPITSEVLDGKFGPFTNWARDRFPGIFKASDDARNAARVGALPEYSSSTDVKDFLERRRDRVDTIASIDEDTARRGVTPAVRDLGGYATEADYDAAIRTAAEARHTKAKESLDDQVAKTRGLTEKLGVIPDDNSKLTALQQYGQQLREGIVAQPRKGSVEEILAKDAEHLYELRDSEVPKKMWNSASTAADDVQDVLKRSNKNFRRIMTDYVGFDFMDKVGVKDSLGRQTGVVDPAKYKTYMQNHRDSFESYERATGDMSLRQRFSDVLSGPQEIGRLQAERAAIEKAFPQLTPGGPIAGIADQFLTGPAGGAKIAGFKQAFANDPVMEEHLFDRLMSKLREEAVNPDGTLNAAKHDAFTKSYEGALKEFDPKLTDRLKTARSAQEILDQQSALRAQTVKDYESSSARFYLNNVDPKDSITKLLTKSDNPASEMQDMVSKVGGDSSALRGLRRDFMDVARNDFVERIDGRDVMNFKKYNNFLSEHERPMRVLYGDDAYNGLRTIGQDLENQQVAMSRLATAGKKEPSIVMRGGGVLGGPLGSALSAVGGAIGSTIIAQMIFGGGPNVMSGQGIAHILNAAVSGIGMAGAKHAVGAARQHGIDTVTDLLGEAAANPQVMKFLLQKAPADSAHPFYQKLGSILTNQATSSIIPKYGNPSEQPIWRQGLSTPPGVIPMIPTGVPPAAPPMAR